MFAVLRDSLKVVGVARATSATTSDSTVEYPADSSHGLPDAHTIGKHLLQSPKGQERLDSLKADGAKS